FNNNFGHDCGDQVLRQLAACVQGVLRDEATLGRLGGEEFAIALPEADLDAGVRVAERIRAEVERHPFQYKGSTYRVTLSLGVAVTTPDVPLTAEALLEKVD